MSHSMIWEESRNSRARTGFSQECTNFISKELVNPRRFVLSKERWIHHKELREELWSRASWLYKWKPKIVTNKAQDVRNWDEIKHSEGTRREGPPFPFNLSTSSQKSITHPREERKEEPRGRTRERARESSGGGMHSGSWKKRPLSAGLPSSLILLTSL